VLRCGLLLALTLLLGCTHTSRKDHRGQTEEFAPPSSSWTSDQFKKDFLKFENQETAADVTDPQSWWLTYRRALSSASTEPRKSCEDFLSLSTKKDFPLWDLAWIRAQLVCPSIDPLYDESASAKNSWYSSLHVLVREKQVKFTTDLKDDVELLVEKSKRETLPKKKERLILEALASAQKTKDAALISSVEERLQQIFPRYTPNPPRSLWLDIALDYRQFRKFEQAQGFYKALLKKNDDLESQWSAWRGLRQIHRTKQDKVATIKIDNEIMAWLKKIMKKNKSAVWTKRWHDHSLTQIRQLWTEDQYDSALKKLLTTIKTFKGQQSLDEAYFLHSRMREERGLFGEAETSLEKALAEKESLPGLREKILWASAWLNYKQKKYQLAIDRLNEALALQIEEPNRFKYLFWKSRAQAQENLSEKTETAQSLVQTDPLGFYGLLAQRDLKKDLPPLGDTKTELLELHLRTIPELSALTGLKIDWLIALQEKEILEEALKNTLDNLKGQKRLSDESWLKFFSAFAQAQLYLPLFSNLNKIKPETRDQLLKHHPELIFARPYDEFVRPASEKTGVSSSLIYGIMRQESAFDPEARSPVDAMGLLQLLPELAKNIAKSKRIPFSQAEDLYDPKTNIPLGAFELKSLLDRYDNRYILSIAAYNANGKAIQGWLKTRMRQDPVEFIEEIPYEETRAYIKLVLRNYVFYERLSNPTTSLTFPEKLLLWP